MRIVRVEIEGWMPFRQRVDLTLPDGPVAIVGIHDGDPTRSNWSGKTSLLEAIVWACYGIHRKRLEDQIIHTDADRAVVTVTFSNGAVVKRERPRGGPSALDFREFQASSKKKDAQDRIVATLGLSEPDALATLVVAQGDVDGLIDRTSGERRAVMSTWLRLDAWAIAAKTARTRVQEAVAALQSARSEEAAVRGNVMTGEDRERYELIIAADLEAAAADQAQADALVEQLARAKNSAEIAATRARRVELARQATVAKAAAQTLRDVLPGFEAARARHAELSAERAVVANEMDQAGRFVRDGFDGTCPVTCQPCPVADEVTSQHESLATRHKQSKNRFAQIVETVAESEAELRRLDGEVRVRQEAAVRYGTFRQTLAAMPAVNDQDESVGPVQGDPARVRQLRESAEQHRRNAANARARLDVSYQSEQQLIAVGERAIRLERAVRVAQLAVRALTAVPRRIAQLRLDGLERRANALLEGHALRLRLSWDRELRDPAARCGCGEPFASRSIKSCGVCGEPRGLGRREELDLLVQDGGPEEDAREKSGGCRTLVGAAIRLAACAMLRDERGSAAAFALVDEPFGALDEHNRDGLARRLAWMLGASGLEQALVVSHDASILDALPHRIVVRRQGNESTAEVVW